MKLNTDIIEKKLQRLRWTHADLAREMGISPALMHYHLVRKRDRPNLIALEKIAAALKLAPKDLLV